MRIDAQNGGKESSKQSFVRSKRARKRSQLGHTSCMLKPQDSKPEDEIKTAPKQQKMDMKLFGQPAYFVSRYPSPQLIIVATPEDVTLDEWLEMKRPLTEKGYLCRIDKALYHGKESNR